MPNVLIINPENIYYVTLFEILNMYRLNRKMSKIFNEKFFCENDFYSSINQTIVQYTLGPSNFKKYFNLYKIFFLNYSLEKTNIIHNIHDIVLYRENPNHWLQLLNILKFWAIKMKMDNIPTTTNFNIHLICDHLKMFCDNSNSKNLFDFSSNEFRGVLDPSKLFYKLKFLNCNQTFFNHELKNGNNNTSKQILYKKHLKLDNKVLPKVNFVYINTYYCTC